MAADRVKAPVHHCGRGREREGGQFGNDWVDDERLERGKRREGYDYLERQGC